VVYVVEVMVDKVVVVEIKVHHHVLIVQVEVLVVWLKVHHVLIVQVEVLVVWFKIHVLIVQIEVLVL
jgi:hypothetical protein